MKRLWIAMAATLGLFFFGCSHEPEHSNASGGGNEITGVSPDTAPIPPPPGASLPSATPGTGTSSGATVQGGYGMSPDTSGIDRNRNNTGSSAGTEAPSSGINSTAGPNSGTMGNPPVGPGSTGTSSGVEGNEVTQPDSTTDETTTVHQHKKNRTQERKDKKNYEEND